MTIETEELQGGAPAAAPQATNNYDDLKSLVRILSDRSKELAERVSLLERGTSDNNKTLSQVERDDDELLSPGVSSLFDAASERSIVRGQFSNDHLEIGPDEKLNAVTGIPEKNNISNDVEEALQERVKLLEQRMEDYEDEKDVLLGNLNSQGEYQYNLAESTISLLITEQPLSIPFVFGVSSIALSISCLSLVLASSINQGTHRNPLGIPAGVAATTRVAQFLGELLIDLMPMRRISCFLIY